MSQRLKHALVLLGLTLLVLVGGWWGWGALTKPFPSLNAGPSVGPCLKTQVQAGTLVRPGQVLVNVLNASDKTGLAGDTMETLLAQGFGEGAAGNAPDDTDVATVEIWTGRPDSPAVALVASYFPGATIVERPDLDTQITVVLGGGFDKLGRGRRAVRAVGEAELCSPKPPADTTA